MFIASSVARVGSSGKRSSVLSSRDASLSCARRCAERAARASLFSVSVETVFARGFVELARGGRDCVDAAESAIEKVRSSPATGRRIPLHNAINFSRPHCRTAAHARRSQLPDQVVESSSRNSFTQGN